MITCNGILFLLQVIYFRTHAKSKSINNILINVPQNLTDYSEINRKKVNTTRYNNIYELF